MEIELLRKSLKEFNIVLDNPITTEELNLLNVN
jgi:hypothetical protein